MTQLASALQRERQTLYGWISGATLPYHASERRLDAIYQIASDWKKYANMPLGRAVATKLSNGQSLCEMLAKDEIDLFEIRPLFPELKLLAELKSRGQQRRERSEAFGFEKGSTEELAERIRMSVPV